MKGIQWKQKSLVCSADSTDISFTLSYFLRICFCLSGQRRDHIKQRHLSNKFKCVHVCVTRLVLNTARECHTSVADATIYDPLKTSFSLLSAGSKNNERQMTGVKSVRDLSFI